MGIDLATACLTRVNNYVMEPRRSRPSGSDGHRVSRRTVQLRDGLEPQPCGSRGLGTGNLRSRYPGIGEAASKQQHEGLALHYPEKSLAQPVEKASKWSSDGRD